MPSQTKIIISEKITKYLHYQKSRWSNKKTYNVIISSVYGGSLGQIKWYPGWRRYAFFPDAETLYDSSCLKDIQNYIDELMAEHKILKEGERNEKSIRIKT
jgi:hypothetical protein